MKFNKLLLILMLAFISTLTIAKTLMGNVIFISDGDTIKVQLENGRVQAVRLAGVNAREKGQIFGEESRRELTAMCLNRLVVAEVRTINRYCHTVARVCCDRGDVATKLLQDSMTWHYTIYVHNQPMQEAVRDRRSQAVAQANGVGLWAQIEPKSPWE